MASIINLKLDGDNAWPDLAANRHKVLHITEEPIGLAVLPGGMQSGKPSIALRIDWPEMAANDADCLVAELSWAVLATAVRAIAARYGWPE
jgi:hypothetical protein